MFSAVTKRPVDNSVEVTTDVPGEELISRLPGSSQPVNITNLRLTTASSEDSMTNFPKTEGGDTSDTDYISGWVNLGVGDQIISENLPKTTHNAQEKGSTKPIHVSTKMFTSSSALAVNPGDGSTDVTVGKAEFESTLDPTFKVSIQTTENNPTTTLETMVSQKESEDDDYDYEDWEKKIVADQQIIMKPL